MASDKNSNYQLPKHEPGKLTRRELYILGAISKAQKAQNTFFEKNLNFFIFFFFRKCRIVLKKVKGGTSWALLTYILLQNTKKTRKGDSFETLKNFRKKSHNVEKKSKGQITNPLVSSGFVGYVKIVEIKRGTLLH